MAGRMTREKSTLAKAKWALACSRARSFLAQGTLLAVGAFALQCNSLLGIDPAVLDQDGGTDSDANVEPDVAPDAGPNDASSTCQDLANTNLCNQCLAQNCCEEIQACRTASTCNYALQSYNGCIFTPGDGGRDCTDPLVQTVTGGRLVDCLSKRCASDCANEPLGDVCETYCGCMQITCCPSQSECSAHIMDTEKVAAVGSMASCLAFCASFTDDERSCRSYHCGQLARRPGADVTTHCGHSVGLMGACP